jgi:tRNA pseudouridine55 synthase
VDGALLVDKPAGPTSHDIVAIVRRALQTPRVGHTGTLDPLATGLLVLLVGQATRCAQFLGADEKEYLADVRLGIATPTYDADPRNFRLKAEAAEDVAEEPGDDGESTRDAVEAGGTTTSAPGSFRLQAEDLERLLDEFRGTFMQRPPPYSAKKIDGVRAYKKARQNQDVDLKPVEVTVRELELLADAPRDAHFAPPDSQLGDPTLLRLRLVCSSGFYVRSLAHDIGQRLGCGAHLEALRRTRAGRFSVADAMSLADLDAQGAMTTTRLMPLNALLADMPAITLNEEGVRRVSHGNTLAAGHLAGPPTDVAAYTHARILDPFGQLLAVAQPRPGGTLHPILVLR